MDSFSDAYPVPSAGAFRTTEVRRWAVSKWIPAYRRTADTPVYTSIAFRDSRWLGGGRRALQLRHHLREQAFRCGDGVVAVRLLACVDGRFTPE